MCGIIGFIGNKNCYPYLILGLKLLQNRGYDSAGISVISENTVHILKYAYKSGKFISFITTS